MDEQQLTPADIRTLDYLTVREVANKLRVSQEQVRQWCVSGELRSANYGNGEKKHRRIKQAWFDAFVRARETLRETPVTQQRRPQPAVWKWEGTRGVVAGERSAR